MSSHIPTFSINPNHGAGRREALERQLDALGLPYQRLPGVHGETLPVDELVRHYDHMRATSQSHELTVGEAGYALSRLGVYQAMTEQNLPYVLILEDDVKLEPDVLAMLDALAQSVSPDEPVVTLFTRTNRHCKHSA